MVLWFVPSGHESRRGEVTAMKEPVTVMGLEVVEMTDPGRMDGGDVLFTGREFFVGQSNLTNEVCVCVCIHEAGWSHTNYCYSRVGNVN